LKETKKHLEEYRRK